MSHMIEKVMEKYGIKHRIRTPYHPQVKSQVESTNKVLESILMKTMENHHQDWTKKLHKALWPYRTTWLRIIGFSPFETVCGKSPLFLVEFEINMFRTMLEVGFDLLEA